MLGDWGECKREFTILADDDDDDDGDDCEDEAKEEGNRFPKLSIEKRFGGRRFVETSSNISWRSLFLTLGWQARRDEETCI